MKGHAEHRSVSAVMEYREPKPDAAKLARDFADAAAENIRHHVGELRRSGALMSVGE